MARGERIKIVEARQFEHPETGEVIALGLDPEEVDAAAADFATVVRTVGGVCSFAAERVQVEEGVWESDRMVFRWHPYAPGRVSDGADGDDGASSEKPARARRRRVDNLPREVEPAPEPEPVQES